ncbi:MAG: hypothetical protein KAI83_14190 [Thiomargarita sp.]|nr:hypothetical protein [Thiomargarita sp.]
MRNNTQSGVALIALLAIFMLSATGILLYRLNNRTDFMLENQAQTAQALAKAKEALIGHAATYAETHPGQPQGYLPCPDNNGDGIAGSTCSTTGNSVIGRFPWKTLGLPPLRDGSGECLWYAVSGSYKCNPKKILTSDSDGLFTVEDSAGNTIAGKGEEDEEKSYHRAIAIVFAPGRIINGQVRSVTGDTPCGENVQIDDYLDRLEIDKNGDNVIDYTIRNFSGYQTNQPSGEAGEEELPTAKPSIFVAAPITREDGNVTEVIFNDVLMLITPKDFEPVYRRMDYWVAERVEGCLNKYAATLDSADEPFDKYPWASQLSSNYIGNNGERFGRISQTPNSSSLYTSMPKVWPIDPHLIDFNSVPEKVLKLKVSELLELLELDKKTEKALTEKFNPDELKTLLTGILEELDLVELNLEVLEKLDLVENIAVNEIKEKLDSNEKTLLEKLDEAEQKELLRELEKQRCFKVTSLDNWEWKWWKEWKEMVFFAVDDEYSPTGSLAIPTMTLSEAKMKMIVLVAGRRLLLNEGSTEEYQQIRPRPPNTDTTEKQKIKNYLEGGNIPGTGDADTIPTGNEEFESKDCATPTFNDVVLGTPPPPP